ncbi:MAG: family 43 glycosylhydrolase, partial [Mameliella sp.]|nr:family 43 glycosylhydrolase [Phaeodactylibacter sp.]
MLTIENPVLKGFQPDPSIIRVGEDYYIATSTFEWFPGVQIHHSRDLKNWRLVAQPLNRLSQLDMAGNPDSCGVWAPCLTYDNGQFYLVYSNVRSFDGIWKDVHNYLVVADQVTGEWSEPIYLNSSGFDPSLFHAPDGKKWVVNMLADHRGNRLFGGIVLQEYDPVRQEMTGPVMKIFDSYDIKNVEGPHLYYYNDYYYLLMAAGGTEYDHCCILARAKTIEGPYELQPGAPVVTTRDVPDWPIQKAGHGDLVSTPDGQWYIAFLCGRPLTEKGRCTLGRETSIAPVEWSEDGWLYLKNGSHNPDQKITIKGEEVPWEPHPERYDFNSAVLPAVLQSLRVPITPDWASLKDRPGYLRLYGQESLSSFHHQSLLAHRLTDFEASA